jgi:opacity protein-like surface antigen
MIFATIQVLMEVMVKRFASILLALMVGFCSIELPAQKYVTLSFGSGISVPTSKWGEYWNMGFNVGGNIFYNFSNNLLIGCHIAYQHWTPDEDDFLKDYDFWEYLWLQANVSGRTSIWEFVPTVRLQTSTSNTRSVRLFSEVGSGLFAISSKTTIEIPVANYSFSETFSDDFSKFGITISGGIIFSLSNTLHIELAPRYTLIFGENSFNFFAMTAAVGFTI